MSDDGIAIQQEIEASLANGEGPAVVRFMMSCLSGLPIVGGPVGAVAEPGLKLSKIGLIASSMLGSSCKRKKC